MTERPKINYTKPSGQPPKARDWTLPEEYPMPLIYDRDDSNDYDPIEVRRQADAEFDRNTPQQLLTPRQYLLCIAGVFTALIALIIIANLV